MRKWEYKVVPAPTKGTKAKGVKTPEARFAKSLEDLMNELSFEGWQFMRAETLPSIDRSGLTGTSTNWRNILVFKRALEEEDTPEVVELLPPPPLEEIVEETTGSDPEPVDEESSEALEHEDVSIEATTEVAEKRD